MGIRINVQEKYTTISWTNGAKCLEKLNSYYGLLVVEYGICLQGMYKHQLNAHAYRALQNKVYVQFSGKLGIQNMIFGYHTPGPESAKKKAVYTLLVLHFCIFCIFFAIFNYFCKVLIFRLPVPSLKYTYCPSFFYESIKRFTKNID